MFEVYLSVDVLGCEIEGCLSVPLILILFVSFHLFSHYFWGVLSHYVHSLVTAMSLIHGSSILTSISGFTSTQLN